MIGIFGDSFVDLNPESRHDKENGILPWPIWFVEKFDMPYMVRGRSGSGIWYAYENFIRNYKFCKIVIISYTNYNRFNGLPDKREGLGFVNEGYQRYADQQDWDFCEAITQYKKYLYNDELQKFIYRKVFEDINNICYDNKIKLINLLSFEKPNELIVDLSKAKFPCLLNLFDVSANEERVESDYNGVLDLRHNHLSPFNNKVMCEIMLETLDKDANYIKVLTEDTRFKYAY